MPGVLAGLIGALMAAIANKETYHYGLYEVFPAMAPANQQNSSDGYEYVLGNLSGDGRSAVQQAGYQLLALLVTMVVGIVSGIITGEYHCDILHCLFLCTFAKSVFLIRGHQTFSKPLITKISHGKMSIQTDSF